MSPNPTRHTKAPTRFDHYEIHILGLLAPQWADWFDGFHMEETEAGDTVLSGQIADQAALHGVLARIRDLNLTLLSINSSGPESE